MQKTITGIIINQMEPTSVFSENLPNRFDLLEQKLVQEAKDLKLLYAYFSNVKKELETFAKNLQKSTNPLKSKLQSNPHVFDTWSYALKAVIGNTEEYCKAITRVANSFTSELITPLEDFVNLHDQCNKSLTGKGNKVLELLQVHKGKVKKSREKYEKAVKAMELTDNIDRDLTRTRSKLMNEALEEYQNTMEEYNEFVDDAEPFYKKQLDLLQRNEENRINFVKAHLAKFFAKSEELAKEYLEMNEGMKKLLEIVKPEEDLKMFVTEAMRVPREKLFIKLSPEKEVKLVSKNSESLPFAKFEEIGTDFETVKKEEVSEADCAFMKGICDALVANKVVTVAQKNRLFELFQVSDARAKFASILSQIPYKCLLENIKAFSSLADIVDMLLNTFAMYNDKDFSVLWQIMSSSYRVLCNPSSTDKTTISLIKEISRNPIWKDKNKWIGMIQHKLTQTIEYYKLVLPKAKQKGILESFWNAGTKFLFGEKEEEKKMKTDQAETRNKVTVGSELGNIALHLAAMQIDIEMGREILIYFAEKYVLDQDKLYQILNDFECAQVLQREIVDKDLVIVSLKVREKERTRYGADKVSFALNYALRFVGDISTLRNLLILSKTVNANLKNRILKYALPLASSDTRHKIWKALIFDPDVCALYNKIKSEQMETFKLTNNSTNNLIKLDVGRSFFTHDEVSKEVFSLNFLIKRNSRQ
eukprot:TRINITY_DN724_c0_g1_i2.p1 TRINITY_DN724_c0_g1~~TRINITY_DN724_c0_g1_i2.p1  ORF type:complete len:704 (-),score=97.71 TRINITY_DN724_c0_g1_i2:873-2984(-)